MPQGMTEEVCRQCEFAEILPYICTLYRTSPAPFGGTLPRGEGLYQNDKLKFEKELKYENSNRTVFEICILRHHE